jgi:hypothetical protein
MAATQTKHPWRATLRTVFAALVAFAGMWALVVNELGLNTDWQWVSISLAVTGGLTRLMALPTVEEFFKRFLPILSAEPKAEPEMLGMSGGDVE